MPEPRAHLALDRRCSADVVAAIDDLELARATRRRRPAHRRSSQPVSRIQRPSSASIGRIAPATISSISTGSLYARSDRLYTRQFRETTNLSVMLALDTSASMAISAGTASAKFRYAADSSPRRSRISPPKQGHAVGLMTMRGRQARVRCRRAAAGHICARCSPASIDSTPGGTWDPARVISRARAAAPAARRRHRAVGLL